MRILQLPGYFPPERAASDYLGENRDRAFGESDIFSLVYTPTPCRGLSKTERKEYKHRKYERFYDGTLEVYRFPMYAEGKNPVSRALRYSLCWIIQLWKGLHVHDIDGLYLASTPPIQGLLGVVLKKWKKIPFVYNLQDIFPDSMVGTGLAKKGGFLWKVGRKIENVTYKNADKIIVISKDFKNNIMAKGVPEAKIVVIYNWVDQNAVVNVSREENTLFDKYHLDRTKFYIEYSGNIGLTQNMDMLLNVMEELKTSHPDINLVLIGDGAYKSNVDEIVANRRLNNVIILPFQPYKDISYVFSLGDAGLVISKPGVGANSVPSKTWSIMSASRPVLANFDENELKDILVDNECGIFTKAGDKEAFKKSILELYFHRDLCEKYGRNGRKFVLDNLTREAGTSKYVDVVKSVVNDTLTK